MSRLRPLLADPVRLSIAVAGLLAAAGIVALLVTSQQMNDTEAVASQVSYLLSGGLAAFALVVFGLGAALLQSARQANARTRAELRAFGDALDELATALGQQRPAPGARDAR